MSDSEAPIGKKGNPITPTSTRFQSIESLEESIWYILTCILDAAPVESPIENSDGRMEQHDQQQPEQSIQDHPIVPQTENPNSTPPHSTKSISAISRNNLNKNDQKPNIRNEYYDIDSLSNADVSLRLMPKDSLGLQ
jgi:hypothetical protein